MATTNAEMCLAKYFLFLICLKILECNAINCRTEGGPKEAVLKDIYAKCMKIQDTKTNNSRSFNDQDWREPRGHSRQDRGRIKDDKGRNDGNDKGNNNERSRDNNDRSRYNNDRSSDNDRSSRDSNDRSNRDGDRSRQDMNERMDNRNDRHNANDRNTRNDMMNNFNRHGSDDRVSARDGFQDDEFGSDMYNIYHSSGQQSRRYKREKQENSGHRSQYNPNGLKSSMHEDNYRGEEMNSSENNSSKENHNKSCALHCFLEYLEMTGDDGKPDKYLVANAITKEVKNEDLKDFLQEAVDDCFQMLENENVDEKCEFSNNLLMCLSEKGRANCDDWKDDLRF